MNKNRVDRVEKLVRETVGKSDFPAPGFFSGSNIESQIENWRADLLKQGFPLEVVRMTPAYIEEC